MTGDSTRGGDPPGGEWDGTTADWPVALRGVTESVVATRGPDDRWNLAALGLRAPGVDEDAADPAPAGAEEDVTTGGDREGTTGPVTARTWGRTRTRGNFERRGSGVVQFVDDPVLFVDAALGIVEREDPVADAAAAWVRVRAERTATGQSGGTEWANWRLSPVETVVRERSVPTIDRAFNATVEATVWASRLDVPAYDEADLLDRLAFLADVVDAAGGGRACRAFDRIDRHTGWTDRR